MSHHREHTVYPPKTYQRETYRFGSTELIVEGPVPPDRLDKLSFHEGLVAFRPPEEQKKALIGIAELPEGRIVIAREQDTVVGYVTFHHPDPLERWADIPHPRIIELGAIEVAPPYRGAGLGKKMLAVAFQDPAMEEFLVFTTEYYWHWDLEGTKLSVWEYRKLMERMMGSAGLVWMATDDPEISAHPANCLMVRIGRHVDRETIEVFDQLRFRHRYMY
ncbi:MAG: Acetyltransferase AcuA, acetyl-CoA synthetase inhibitor [Candidatus Carbobacillus altaicus]|uniref:Acetyltransferase AcuA, acetyl-CoA synthetase inhibitor n=1 Tax=Candidatus Carbonibacillus altaicus TaxID=2163959 RepID=A0A2R6Y1I1_9BACL|nr:MAG: Acetyltransferase AcuA, acetyl-CoA synthetase inhibitor [Candidatus Carbobacillus altaicus]